MTQRQPRERDETFLAFVRRQPCCIPGCAGKAEAAHIRMGDLARGKRSTGIGEKPSDRYCVPLCAYHHREGPQSQHAGSEAAFWSRHCINPFDLAAALYALGAGTATTAKPKRNRPPRQKIKTNWPARPFPKGRGFTKKGK